MYTTDAQKLSEYKARLKTLEQELVRLIERPFGIYETLSLLTREIRWVKNEIERLEERLNPTFHLDERDYSLMIKEFMKITEEGYRWN